MNNMKTYELVVIGGGPVGLYALYYAGLRDIRAKILETLNDVGSSLQLQLCRLGTVLDNWNIAKTVDYFIIDCIPALI